MRRSSRDPTSEKPPDGGSGIALDTMLRRPSFLRVLLVLDATLVVLVGMRLAAPILFAVVLSLLFGPLYAWVKRRGVPTPAAP